MHLHDEQIKTVILFLRELGLSTFGQKLLLYYQYGDGTLDGSGEKRKNYYETYDWLKNGIKEFNEEINLNHQWVEKIVDRVMFQGVDKNAPKADYIYQGDLTYGTAISREQVLTHLKRKTYDYYENLHIGPLMVRPHARYSRGKIKNEKLRNRIVFYWPNFPEDVRYINRRYNKK